MQNREDAYSQILRSTIAQIPKQHQGDISISSSASYVTGVHLSCVVHVLVMGSLHPRVYVPLNEPIILVSG